MKRLTVGRSNDCDIVIIDETDNVSRHHLVITFDFFGKMKVSDTSSNGTMINGTQMLKGASIPVTTKDNIRLGRSCYLDWSLVKDPYKSLRVIILCLLVAVLLAGIGIGGYFWYKEYYGTSDNLPEQLVPAGVNIVPDDKWTRDSTEKVAPTIKSIDVNNGLDVNKNKGAKSKKKSDAPQVSRKKTVQKKVSESKERKDYSKASSTHLDSIAVF